MSQLEWDLLEGALRTLEDDCGGGTFEVMLSSMVFRRVASRIPRLGEIFHV